MRIGLLLLCLCSWAVSASESLIVGVMTVGGDQRTMYRGLASEFELLNPGVRVRLIELPEIEYKRRLEQWMGKGGRPDVLYGQAGSQLMRFIANEKLVNISDVWAQEKLEGLYSKAVIQIIARDEKRFALPVSYYQWGFYYRKSIFEELRLSEPKTWPEFIRVCQTLKRAGLVPISLGNRDLWPAAAWFDYLNLRINGLSFHSRLLRGEIAFSSPKLDQVFSLWGKLIENKFFLPDSHKYSLSESMPFLYHNIAAMTLSANFTTSSIPSSVKNDFGYFPFPIVESNVGIYEDAPLDMFFIPHYTKKREMAKKFLAFMSMTKTQKFYNQKMGTISPQNYNPTSRDYFIQKGYQVLSKADGLSQYFDRDVDERMKEGALQAFAEFLKKPDKEKVKRALEKNRQTSLEKAHLIDAH